MPYFLLLCHCIWFKSKLSIYVFEAAFLYCCLDFQNCSDNSIQMGYVTWAFTTATKKNEISYVQVKYEAGKLNLEQLITNN